MSMETVNTNSVLGVMEMLNTEESYIQFNRTLWILRAIMMKGLERKHSDDSYDVDNQNDDYWIYELTNNLIAVSWIKGYDFFIKEHKIDYCVSQPREGHSFMTYDEAQCIVTELQSGNMLTYLRRLRDLAKFAKERFNDKAYYVYALADDLLCAVIGEKNILQVQ